MPYQQHNHRHQEDENRNFVDAMHHSYIEVSLAVGILFSEEVSEHFAKAEIAPGFRHIMFLVCFHRIYSV